MEVKKKKKKHGSKITVSRPAEGSLCYLEFLEKTNLQTKQKELRNKIIFKLLLPFSSSSFFFLSINFLSFFCYFV